MGAPLSYDLDGETDASILQVSADQAKKNPLAAGILYGSEVEPLQANEWVLEHYPNQVQHNPHHEIRSDMDTILEGMEATTTTDIEGAPAGSERLHEALDDSPPSDV